MLQVGINQADLRRLRPVLKAADKDIRREFAKAAMSATKPVKQAIRDSALQTLPKSGGLNRWAAALGIKTRVALTGRNPGVFITGALDNKRHSRKVGSAGKRRKVRKAGLFGAQADLRALNRGRVMHPAWGRGPLVGPQMVRSGFWDRPLQGPIADKARKEIITALQDVLDKLASKA